MEKPVIKFVKGITNVYLYCPDMAMKDDKILQ